VFFVIDALDECFPDSVRRQFLIWIRDLPKSNHQTSIKVLTTRRHDSPLGMLAPRDGLILYIKASREDMGSLLDASLDYLPRFIQRKPELWAYIRNQIIKSAGEM